MREIIEQITAGSQMVENPIILIQRPIRLGLIKDQDCPKTFEMAKEQERKVELPGIKPRAFGLPCQVLCH